MWIGPSPRQSTKPPILRWNFLLFAEPGLLWLDLSSTPVTKGSQNKPSIAENYTRRQGLEAKLGNATLQRLEGQMPPGLSHQVVCLVTKVYKRCQKGKSTMPIQGKLSNSLFKTLAINPYLPPSFLWSAIIDSFSQESSLMTKLTLMSWAWTAFAQVK